MVAVQNRWCCLQFSSSLTAVSMNLPSPPKSVGCHWSASFNESTDSPWDEPTVPSLRSGHIIVSLPCDDQLVQIMYGGLGNAPDPSNDIHVSTPNIRGGKRSWRRLRIRDDRDRWVPPGTFGGVADVVTDVLFGSEVCRLFVHGGQGQVSIEDHFGIATLPNRDCLRGFTTTESDETAVVTWSQVTLQSSTVPRPLRRRWGHSLVSLKSIHGRSNGERGTAMNNSAKVAIREAVLQAFQLPSHCSVHQQLFDEQGTPTTSSLTPDDAYILECIERELLPAICCRDAFLIFGGMMSPREAHNDVLLLFRHLPDPNYGPPSDLSHSPHRQVWLERCRAANFHLYADVDAPCDATSFISQWETWHIETLHSGSSGFRGVRDEVAESMMDELDWETDDDIADNELEAHVEGPQSWVHVATSHSPVLRHGRPTMYRPPMSASAQVSLQDELCAVLGKRPVRSGVPPSPLHFVPTETGRGAAMYCPPTRRRHSALLWGDDIMVVFGGRNVQEFFGRNLWMYSISLNAWMVVNECTPRAWLHMVLHHRMFPYSPVPSTTTSLVKPFSGIGLVVRNTLLDFLGCTSTQSVLPVEMLSQPRQIARLLRVQATRRRCMNAACVVAEPWRKYVAAVVDRADLDVPLPKDLSLPDRRILKELVNGQLLDSESVQADVHPALLLPCGAPRERTGQSMCVTGPCLVHDGTGPKAHASTGLQWGDVVVTAGFMILPGTTSTGIDGNDSLMFNDVHVFDMWSLRWSCLKPHSDDCTVDEVPLRPTVLRRPVWPRVASHRNESNLRRTDDTSETSARAAEMILRCRPDDLRLALQDGAVAFDLPGVPHSTLVAITAGLCAPLAWSTEFVSRYSHRNGPQGRSMATMTALDVATANSPYRSASTTAFELFGGRDEAVARHSLYIMTMRHRPAMCSASTVERPCGPPGCSLRDLCATWLVYDAACESVLETNNTSQFGLMRSHRPCFWTATPTATQDSRVATNLSAAADGYLLGLVESTRKASTRKQLVESHCRVPFVADDPPASEKGDSHRRRGVARAIHRMRQLAGAGTPANVHSQLVGLVQDAPRNIVGGVGRSDRNGASIFTWLQMRGEQVVSGPRGSTLTALCGSALSTTDSSVVNIAPGHKWKRLQGSVVAGGAPAWIWRAASSINTALAIIQLHRGTEEGVVAAQERRSAVRISRLMTASKTSMPPSFVDEIIGVFCDQLPGFTAENELAREATDWQLILDAYSTLPAR